VVTIRLVSEAAELVSPNPHAGRGYEWAVKFPPSDTHQRLCEPNLFYLLMRLLGRSPRKSLKAAPLAHTLRSESSGGLLL
jgi:hypothetical protein